MAVAATAPDQTAFRLPQLNPFVAYVELILIVGMALFVTMPYDRPGIPDALNGREVEWLTNSAYTASHYLRTQGYIPLWQPWLGFGEPLIDNPFSFLLNPVSSAPTLIYGIPDGLKYSVVLTAILAGLGGWALGRMLGLESLGRVFLALLCLGKGNMHAMIETGYFQLGTSQAYIPWVTAGFLGVLRLRRARWAIVLTAVSFTFLFFAGNVWYTLPTLIGLALLTPLHVVSIRTKPRAVAIDWPALRRVILTGVVTAGLCAVTLLPIWANRDRIGNHPNDPDGGKPVDIVSVVQQYFNGDPDLYEQNLSPGLPNLYYSFTIPLWFILAVLIVTPLVKHLLRAGPLRDKSIWAVGLCMIILCTVWGAGGTPIFVWLYQNVPLLGQWRFVGRALAVSAFWIGVLVAMRVDDLWRALLVSPIWHAKVSPVLARLGDRAMAILLTGACTLAAFQVNLLWGAFGSLTKAPGFTDVCVAWLREQHPDAQLALYTRDYIYVYPYLEYNIRLTHISADFKMLPTRGTLYNGDLTLPYPKYAVAWDDGGRKVLDAIGYHEMPDSPHPFDSHPCLYERPDAFSYAFSISYPDLYRYNWAILPPSVTTPIDRIARNPDQIFLEVNGLPDNVLIVVVQEEDYPGWTAEVDGQPVYVESIGGLIGVPVQAGTGKHTVVFRFRPPLLYIGGLITILTALFCMLYLLQADRLIPLIRRRPQSLADENIVQDSELPGAN